MIKLLNIDCMDYMATLKDKEFDLAICDPYYEIPNKLKRSSYGKLTSLAKYDSTKDLKPTTEYWKQLFRVSKNQIVFGGNYFSLPISSGWIVWDKNNGKSNFADGELAWSSFNKSLRIIKETWCGGSARNESGIDKIHPFQKPIKLYKELLRRYSEKGETILDTHLGSGSSAIACYDEGFNFVGCEISKEYFDKAKNRFDQHKLQVKMF